MYQSPWILQALIDQQQCDVRRAAAPPRSDPSRPVPRFPRLRLLLADVRSWTSFRAPARPSPPARRVPGALARRGAG